MKVKEILQQYAEGRRDFRNLNLRGKSFRGQNLSGADFSGCDLRGTNFKGAILQGTMFCQAKAGLQKRWVIIKVLISWLISLLSGGFSWLSSYLIASCVWRVDTSMFPIFGIIIISLLIIIIRKGFNGYVIGAFAIAGFITGFVAEQALGQYANGHQPILGVFGFAVVFVRALLVARAVAFVGAVGGPFAVVVTFILAIAVDGIFALNGTTPLLILSGTGIEFLSVVVVIVFTSLGVSLGRRSLKGDPRDEWIYQIAIAEAAKGGTSFYRADLTDADFTEATLKSTDLRGANLTRTCWQKTKQLDRARGGKKVLRSGNRR